MRPTAGSRRWHGGGANIPILLLVPDRTWHAIGARKTVGLAFAAGADV
jgi:hypothetical protein